MPTIFRADAKGQEYSVNSSVRGTTITVSTRSERWVLRYLVNQEGTTLLMATIGISYFLDGMGQIIFGSSVYSIDVGMPKDPAFILDSVFQGGLLISLEDLTLDWVKQPPVPAIKHALTLELARTVGAMHRGGVNHRDREA